MSSHPSSHRPTSPAMFLRRQASPLRRQASRPRASVLSLTAAMLLAVAWPGGPSGPGVAQAAEKVKPTVRPLWPGKAPGQTGDTDRDKPQLWVYLPNEKAGDSKPNGCAVVICPGGGYGGLAIGHEGHQVARYFNGMGVAAFICKYRVSPYRHPIPLGDAQRAIRTVRHHAKDFGIDPKRVGVMGFSAGGHLASTVATKFDAGNPEAKDPIDKQSSRPDFAILCYPVITMTDPYTHKGSRNNLLGKDATKEQIDNLSSEKHVTKDTPPTFIFQTDEDRAVPAENAVMFYLALRKAKVPAEMHIYQHGRHGVGLASGDAILKTWSTRLSDWLGKRGFLNSKQRAAVDAEVKVNGQPVKLGFIQLKPSDLSRFSVTAPLRGGRASFDEAHGPLPGAYRVTVWDMNVGWNAGPDAVGEALSFDKASGKPIEVQIQPGRNKLVLALAEEKKP